MNNFSSYQKSKVVFGILCAVVIFLISSLGGFGFMTQATMAQVSGLMQDLKVKSNSVDNFLFLLQNLQATELENQNLKLQISLLSSQLENFQAVKNELDTVKQEKNIFSKDLPASILATVIKYSDSPNIGYIYIYTADQSVTVNQFVVVNGYIIGQITEVSAPYAKVKLLTSPDTELNVKVGNNTTPAILKGKSGLSLTVSDIKIDTAVTTGDAIYLYQSSPLTDWGYKLGTVTQVNNLEVQGEKQLDAQSGLDLNNLKYVFIYRDVF